MCATRTHTRGDGSAKSGARTARPAPAQPAAEHTPALEQTAGPDHSLPHRAAMERAFGLSFGHVTARTGAGAALDPLNANAATRGTHMVFREPTPRPGQVAHELTHVLQQRQPSGERGVSPPGSAAEREAGRNALRVDFGLAPTPPRERASPDVIHRDIKSDLRAAMKGWGTDEEGIYDRLGKASDDEKQLVREDPALMAELQDELNRSEWVRALNLLGQGIETQIREAGSGWGTDEEGIYRAVEKADVAAVKQMLGNGTLLVYLRDELTDGELGRVLGTAAATMDGDGGTKKEEVFHALMLFPDTVGEACNRFEGGKRGEALAADVITKMDKGAAMQAQAVADVDVHIANDGNKNRILASLAQRWDFGAGKVTDNAAGTAKVTTPGATEWSTDLIRKAHKALKMVPASHVTQVVADIKFVGVDPSLGSGAGWWLGGPNLIGLSEDSAGIASTVRHEVGHAIDDALETKAGKDNSETWKKGDPNKWNWGSSIEDIWENRMSNPWIDKDGNEVPDADKAPIRAAIEQYAKKTDCKTELRDYVRGLSPTHVMLNYFGKRVPVIEAARKIAGDGKAICWNKGKMMLDNGSRFSWKPNRNSAFLVFSDFVWQNVENDYALSNHPEFFAVNYEEYYAEGAGEERKSSLKVAQWQKYFDESVHGAA